MVSDDKRVVIIANSCWCLLLVVCQEFSWTLEVTIMLSLGRDSRCTRSCSIIHSLYRIFCIHNAQTQSNKNSFFFREKQRKKQLNFVLFV